MTSPIDDLAAAREQFLALVESVRPDLHRYTSRLVGSAIDGEDIVQDALAKAFYALGQMTEMPALRPWLFAIARNAALDHLRRYDRRFGEALDEETTMSDDEVPRDPFAMRAALAAFAALPIAQRSAVILKDVLGESLEDIAAHQGVTLGAVKSLLVRGRAALAEHADAPPAARAVSSEDRARVDRYAALVNARDWPGVQALLLDECRLDLVAKSQRRGKSVGGYFANYARETELAFRVGTCEGRLAIGAFRGDAFAYPILLAWDGDRVALIRDFRYVPYLADALDFTPLA